MGKEARARVSPGQHPLAPCRGAQAVGESIAKPLDYYENNIGGLLNVLAAADKAGVKRIGGCARAPHAMHHAFTRSD
jgi:hypothetical protein